MHAKVSLLCVAMVLSLSTGRELAYSVTPEAIIPRQDAVQGLFFDPTDALLTGQQGAAITPSISYHVTLPTIASLTQSTASSTVTTTVTVQPMTRPLPTTSEILQQMTSSAMLSTNISPTSILTGQRSPVGAAAASAPTVSSEPLQGVIVTSQETSRDPAAGPFPGGFPLPLPDVPVTILFLLLFMGGAFTHISIYRANAKRGHKFLLSDLMFDFCMIRNLTCIFRIVWSFISPRGVILVALIFENGGAAVIFAVNLFFAQRIFRAMHPKIGWHPLFAVFTLSLIWSVPAIIILNIISLSVSWFSVGKEAQLARAEKALMFGAGWNVMLSVMPLFLLLVAGALPMPRKPETFGTGSLVTKTTLVAYASSTLAVGAAVRAAAIINPADPNTGDVLFGKGLFYTTGFMLEILVVTLYAVARIDLLFHIPDGSSKPGDYSASQKVLVKKGLSEMRYDIEENLGRIGIQYEAISQPVAADEKREFLFAKLAISKTSTVEPQIPNQLAEDQQEDGTVEVFMLPRPNRVSRRATMMQAIKPNRPWRDTIQGPYITGPLDLPFTEDRFPVEKS